jgi:SRSO17 transposase
MISTPAGIPRLSEPGNRLFRRGGGSASRACSDAVSGPLLCHRGEIRYFISNAPPRTALKQMLQAAFSRWGIEHLFRVAKTEIGLGYYEGRCYRGLMRHLMLCQLMLLFLAEQAQRLRGEKTPVDPGADGAGAQRGVPALAAA